MKLHSVFLRKGRVLPIPLNPLRTPFGEYWTHVEEIPASVFESMIGQAGSHFIWTCGSISRRGFGRTPAQAVEHALSRVLTAISRQTNAAEFDSVRIVKYMGLNVANVTMQRRRIQQQSQLEAREKVHSKALHAT